MRTWLLLALLGLVLFLSLQYREGADDTLSRPPTCPAGMELVDYPNEMGKMCFSSTGGVDAVCPTNTTESGTMCLTSSSNSSSSTLVGKMCPPNTARKVWAGQCFTTAIPTCPSGYIYDNHMKTCKSTATSTTTDSSPVGKCNTYWDAAVAAWANGQRGPPEAPGDPDCMPYAPSWIRELSDAGNLLVSSTSLPTAATKAQAIIEQKQATDYAAETTATKAYAASTGYAALAAAAADANNGSLPPPIDESADSDIGAVRPGGGTVYTDSNSPFSGRPGTGQGLGSNIPPSSNTYGSGAGYSSTTVARNTGLASGPTVIKPSTNVDLQVGGPKYGGLGAPIASSNSGASYTTGPILYGPKAAQNKNIDTTNWMPSYSSAGSDWTNMFAGTSRVPGDQDLIPNPYLQSSAYSLANGSQKTNPVPFLSDFSAFQS